MFFLCLGFGGLAAGFVGALVAAYSRGLPDVEALRTYQPSATTRVFDARGNLIATVFKENRTWIPIEKVPECVRQAIIASEDQRFYQHPGVDLFGIGRAAWWAARSHGVSQGASTITMQLARSVFLNTEVSARRKIQEALISVKLERKFTKEQLLEFYLNQIYFGSGAYGVQAAAETYFNKKAWQLNLAEAALIVGTVPAPSEYSPFVNPKVARERQELVLRRMVDCGFIKAADARKALEVPLERYLARPRKDQFVLKSPYFTTYVLHELSRKYGEETLYKGGLRIYTTLDPDLQEAAQEAILWGLEGPGAGHNVHQGALVAIEPETGYIKAFVGGTGWTDKNQFNRAWQAQRPAGSSFKIFVYSTALENGLSPDAIVPDSPVNLKVGPGDWWSPKNSDGRFMGSIPLRTALQYSRNTVSARLVDRLTPGRVIDLAYKMGLRSKVEPQLSIALGACSVTPLDMASALAVLAYGGRRVEPTMVKVVMDGEGKVIEDHRKPVAQQVMSALSAFAMSEMMENAVAAGTGYSARLPEQPVAGKTGTTDSHRDAWFCGFTPRLAAAVWVGNDDNSQMWGTFGGDVPAPIWRHFMEKALKGQAVQHFGADKDGNVSVGLCTESGRRANVTCKKVEHKTFSWRSVPQRFCTLHVFEGTHSASGDGDGKAKPTATPTSEAGSDAPQPSATPEEPASPVETPASPAPSGEPSSDPETATGGASRHPATEPTHEPGPPPTAAPPRPVEPPRPTPREPATAPEGPRPTPAGPPRPTPRDPGPAATPSDTSLRFSPIS